jgi:hypothetical protein
MPTAGEQHHAEDGEVHRDPCGEAAASMLERTRLSESSDTGVHSSHWQSPWEIMVASLSL